MATLEEVMSVALALLRSGRAGEAEPLCRLAVREAPGSAQAWFLLGTALQILGKPADAVPAYERTLEIDPDRLEAMNNLGAALCAIGRVEEAVGTLGRVLTIRPDYADAHNNLGNVRQREGRFDDAIACYRAAIRHRPDYLDAHHNLGNAQRAGGRPDLAIESYERALELSPDHPRVRLGRALAWLQMGDYARGWSEHEWRFRCPEHAIPGLPGPRWAGAALEGRTILLHADSGLGDALMFIRYARDVADRGGDVVLACRRPLARLLKRSPGVRAVVTEGDDFPRFDVHAPLMSLPAILGATGPTGPDVVPYLVVEDRLVERFRRELAAIAGPRIGIAWQGNPDFHRDAERSFRLELFEPLARDAGATLISLQKGHGADQIAALDGRFPVLDLGCRLDDLAETAAVMKNLDLVVTSDTSLAHLAGGLGVPNWIALGFAPDWRWQLGRDDSPWYPKTRLFRQRRFGDWGEVFQRMAMALKSAGTAR